MGPGTGPGPAAKNSYDHCPASAHILTHRATKRSPERRRINWLRLHRRQRLRPFHALRGGPATDHERLGAEKRMRPVYKVWEEGKAPDFVLEVASPST